MILLIPGYGVEVVCDKLSYNLNETRGFDGFDSLIASGRAHVFSWGENQNYSVLDFVSPLKQWQLFSREKQLAAEQSILLRLDSLIQDGKFSTIVCHSLGALILVNYLQKFDLPKRIKKVVFVQACIDNEYFLSSRMVRDMLEQDKFKFVNYWCWWDQALISYSILNKRSVIGLGPDRSLKKYSQFLPLTKLWNLHTSSIRNRQIVDIC